MIEKMKTVSVIAQTDRKTELLDTLRGLGILHLAEKKEADPALTERFSVLSKLSFELKEYAKETPASEELLSDAQFEKIHQTAHEALKRKAVLREKQSALQLQAQRLRPWGDFDPAQLDALRQNGLDFHFYRLDKKEYIRLSRQEEIRFFRLAPVEKMNTVAVLGALDESFGATEFLLPDMGLGALEREIAACETELAACEETLRQSAAYLKSYSAQLLKTQNDAEYSSVSRTVEGDGDLIWLSGYLPESETKRFTDAAAQHGWAWALGEVAEEDTEVPTKVRYNKLTALIKPVFEILGTVPGYREYDISFWFLAFFTLFFAMIIGDAGYGLLFLLGAVVLHIKTKKVSNITLLLYLLSGATVVWGAITGTWFGLEEAMKIPFLKALVLPGFANYPEYFGTETAAVQNHVMKFCFSIGVIQLALACVMNIRKKIGKKDLSWIADLGWLGSISALYFLVLYLVVGQSINLTAAAAVVIVGFLLVVLFGGMAPGKTFGQGLKSGLADSFTVFLNTISAFGNVMSYIRLFAVGMASLAIAQSFNNMASGFSGALVIVGAVIMIFGHVLNIVMGFLSVAVHGVRLNLLEFSGQLGMEWSGTAYEPFCEHQKLKK